MRFSTILPFAALAIAGVSASMPTTPFAQIMKRQFTSPDACISKCQGVTDKVTACGSDIKCICNNSLINGFIDCANCGIAADPSLQTTMQQYLDTIAQGCKAAGVDIGNPTLNGGATGNTGSTGNTGNTGGSGGSSAAATSTRTPGGTGDNSGGGANGLGANSSNGASTLTVSAVGVVVGVSALFAGLL